MRGLVSGERGYTVDDGKRMGMKKKQEKKGRRRKRRRR